MKVKFAELATSSNFSWQFYHKPFRNNVPRVNDEEQKTRVTYLHLRMVRSDSESDEAKGHR